MTGSFVPVTDSLRGAERLKQSPLSRRSPARAKSEHADTIALSVTLLELLNQQGHSYALIDEFAGQPLPLESEEAVPSLPPKDEWLATLNASDLVGDGTGDEPLVLTSTGKLQFARFYHAEQRIWANIRTRLEMPADDTGFDKLKPLIQQLFGPPTRRDRHQLAGRGCGQCPPPPVLRDHRWPRDGKDPHRGPGPGPAAGPGGEAQSCACRPHRKGGQPAHRVDPRAVGRSAGLSRNNVARCRKV